jgi:RNA polymerase sigma factor (sigma-70 family)
MSNKPWWTVISSRELFQLRARLLSYLDESYSGILAADREELVQEALLILIRNKDRVLPDDDGLFQYARRVAKNAALDLVKSAAYRMATARSTGGSQAPVGPSASQKPAKVGQFRGPSTISPSASAQTEKNEEIRRIREIFCELDDLNRLILWSYVVDGQSINAIAKQLDINWHRVAYMIEQSLNRFRQHLS